MARTETVHRPPSGNDTARVSAGQDALRKEHDRLLTAAGATVNVARFAFHYARAVLEQDDEQGRLQGQVTRYDEIQWRDIAAAGRAAEQMLEDEHQGQHVTDCRGCDLRRAVGRLRRSVEVAKRAGVDLSRTPTDGGGSAAWAGGRTGDRGAPAT